MVNIETLPRLIEVVGTPYWYNLTVHVTAWNKLCVGYRLVDKWALENSDLYYLFSCVVEPDMDHSIEYTDNNKQIVDVPSFEMAVNVLSVRVNKAIEKGTIAVRQ